MGPEHTTCVEEKDFAELNTAYIGALAAATVLGGLAAVFTGGSSLLIAGGALLETIRYVLNWILHGKLICLHRNQADCLCGGPSGTHVCAIGEIVTTENVGEDKNFYEDIDDDFAINLALFPFAMTEFSSKGFIDWKPDFLDDESAPFWSFKQDLVQLTTSPGHPQGDLLTRHVSRHGTTRKFGYLTTLVMQGKQYFPYTDVVERDAGSDEDARWAAHVEKVKKNEGVTPEKFAVPVLHCEFEGSRASDMLAALEGFPFGKSFCKKNWLTKFICKVVAAVLAPFALAALALAWLRNTEGSAAPAIADGKAVGPKSQVIVRGSWRYDGAHEGWNEIHAVRVLQTVENVPSDPTAFKAFLHMWCELLAETPMSDGAPRQGPISVGVSQSQLVAAADATVAAQNLPENQWVFHPLVDGCRPADRPPVPPPDPPPIH